MKKFLIQIFILLLLVFSVLYITVHPEGLNGIISPIGTGNLEQKKLQIGDTIITVEIADTQSKRSQGLSGRDSLGDNTGMLFVFPNSQKYQFWMKDMKFDLDMIFINNGKIVDFIKNVPAPKEGTKDVDLPRYEPIVPVNMVLEVSSGFIDKHNIKPGDSINLVAQ